MSSNQTLLVWDPGCISVELYLIDSPPKWLFECDGLWVNQDNFTKKQEESMQMLRYAIGSYSSEEPVEDRPVPSASYKPDMWKNCQIKEEDKVIELAGSRLRIVKCGFAL